MRIINSERKKKRNFFINTNEKYERYDIYKIIKFNQNTKIFVINDGNYYILKIK